MILAQIYINPKSKYICRQHNLNDLYIVAQRIFSMQSSWPHLPHSRYQFPPADTPLCIFLRIYLHASFLFISHFTTLCLLPHFPYIENPKMAYQLSAHMLICISISVQILCSIYMQCVVNEFYTMQIKMVSPNTGSHPRTHSNRF